MISQRSTCFFFFQAEDGIRDADVTGVQTCALPIFSALDYNSYTGVIGVGRVSRGRIKTNTQVKVIDSHAKVRNGQIGRASCRERVQNTVVAVLLTKKSVDGYLGVHRAETTNGQRTA